MSSNIGIIAILHSANLNPRPTWGATNLFLGVQRPDAFQPALPRGERLCARAACCEYVHISIRAPAWGATAAEIVKKGEVVYFNPRPPRGGATENGL